MLDERNSFSTTDSTPSLPYHIHDHPKAKPPIRHVPSVDAYNTWAEVYDTDGNMLQSIDDHELETLLPEFLQLVITSTNEDKGKPNTPLIDFGCGTGRTTQTLIHAPWPPNSKVQIQGIDASGILSLAGQNPKNIGSALPRKEETVEFHFDNFLNTRNPRSAIMLGKRGRRKGKKRKIKIYRTDLNTRFRTLPLSPFYLALSSLLETGGLAMVSNMHPDMGSQSQAGFLSQDTSGNAVKIQGRSWVHGVQETIAVAEKYGFEVVGEVRERGVSEEMVERGVVGERGRKWIGVKVWYGFILRKEG